MLNVSSKARHSCSEQYALMMTTAVDLRSGTSRVPPADPVYSVDSVVSLFLLLWTCASVRRLGTSKSPNRNGQRVYLVVGRLCAVPGLDFTSQWRDLTKTAVEAPAHRTLTLFDATLYSLMPTVNLALQPYRFSFALPRLGSVAMAPGGRLISATSDVRDFTSSILPFDRLMPGTTQPPQLHCIPCQAYLPTFV